MKRVMGLGLLLALAFSAQAAMNRRQEFGIDLPEALARGELESIAIAPDGALLPAATIEELFSGEVPYVWGVVPDGEGGAFVATGSNGRLYSVSGDGEVAELASTFEYELFALAGGRDGELYVSGAPNGTITRVNRDGATEVLIDLPEGLVWDLLQAPDGALYAATGDRGEIYRITGKEKAERIGRVPDSHVVALAWWNDRLLCGTDGHGLLTAVDPETGEAEVLYDSEREEVVAILPLGHERVLFAANSAMPTGGATQAGNGSLMLPTIEVNASGSGASGSVLYELGPGGFVEPVWTCPERDILCLAEAQDGTILVGTGGEGVLYGIDSLRNATRLLDLEESQVLSIATQGRYSFLGTGNGGALYRLDWEGERTGTYTSIVFDARQIAEWGMPHWIAMGRGDLRMETRSGRVREPGETWSDWAPLAKGRISSPAGRFLQWRLTLTAKAEDDLRVRHIRLPYHGPNRAPRILDVRVSAKAAELEVANAGRPASLRQTLPGGVKVEVSFDKTGNGASGDLERTGIWARSLRTAVWIPQDDDDDELRYDLALREIGEQVFLPLKLDLADEAYSWDATAWPEGWYELRVIARDDESNAPGEGLAGQRLSSPFQIDNTPPTLRHLQLEETDGDLILSGEASDAISRIATIEFSLDGEGWRIGHAEDGLLDSRSERFRFRLPTIDEGRRPSVVGIRVADEVGHVAASRLRTPR